jgi:hypothetical protein
MAANSPIRIRLGADYPICISRPVCSIYWQPLQNVVATPVCSNIKHETTLDNIVDVMRMLRVPSLGLPKSLPHVDAIRSFGDNSHSYEPEFWEFQYHIYRYLERAPDTLLIERYKDLLRNMRALISSDRDVIPIQSFLSSWYWFRKEHQTRLEFALRHANLPVTVPLSISFNNEASGAPMPRPRHPNAGDVLFRYDKRVHIENLAQKGLIRIRPVSDFRKMENDRARQDEECSKKSFLPGAHTRITMKDGRNIPILGDVEQTVSMSNYYVFCMACDWDEDLFTAFEGADTCIVIKDTEQFAGRMKAAAAPQLPGWYFHHNPVHYFDPYERTKNEYFDAAMSKDFRFAYQREYRFLWFPQNGEVFDGFKFLELGSLGHLAEVHAKKSSHAQHGATGGAPKAACP